MSLPRSMVAGMAGQKPRRPQFVGIAKVLRFPARQGYQPCLGLKRDRRLPTGTRAIIERSHRAFSHRTLDTPLDGLMMQSQSPTDCKERGIFSISQQYPRPLDPARRLSSRLRYRSQLRRIHLSERQLDRPPPRCHVLPSCSNMGTRGLYRGPKTKMNPPLMTTFMESIV
jgi:hypothetical protein